MRKLYYITDMESPYSCGVLEYNELYNDVIVIVNGLTGKHRLFKNEKRAWRAFQTELDYYQSHAEYKLECKIQ